MFKIQKLSNPTVMESGNRRRRGAEERSCGGTEESCGSRAEERLAAAVVQRRDWLRRWRGGEIGGTVTLRRDGEEMENRKTGKSMEVVARLEAMVDDGVIGGDGGQWRDWRRWWTVA